MKGSAFVPLSEKSSPSSRGGGAHGHSHAGGDHHGHSHGDSDDESHHGHSHGGSAHLVTISGAGDPALKVACRGMSVADACMSSPTSPTSYLMPVFDSNYALPLPCAAASNAAARRRLILSCMLCGAFMMAELIGGYFANSLAIMTDAAHLLSDLAGLGLLRV